METVVPHAKHHTLNLITASSKMEQREKLATFLLGLHPDSLPYLAGVPLAPYVILPNDKEAQVHCNLSSVDNHSSIWDFDSFLEPNKLCATTLIKQDKEDTLFMTFCALNV
jgi:hypothetical protein